MTNDALYLTIAKKLNSNNFFDFMERYNLTYNEMLGIIQFGISSNISLVQCCYLKELLKKMQCLFKIEDEKIGIVSDTHIGSPFMNWDYIHRAYQLFEEQNINTVLHLGDMFDGYCGNTIPKNSKKRNQLVFTCYEQILDFAKNYPNGFDTFVILGNHDVRLHFLGIDVWDYLLEKRTDVFPLGYGSCLLQFGDFPLFLEHPTDSNILSLASSSDQIVLRGHSHIFRLDKNIVNISSCSNLGFSYSYSDAIGTPGCAILSRDKHKLFVDGYIFRKDSTTKEIQYTLKKKN